MDVIYLTLCFVYDIFQDEIYISVYKIWNFVRDTYERECIRLGKDRSDQDKFLVLNAIDFERSFIAFIFVPIRILFVSACTK